MTKLRGSTFSIQSWYKIKIYIEMIDGSVIVDYADSRDIIEVISMVTLKHGIDVNSIEGVWFEMDQIKPIKIYSEEPDFVKEYKKRVGESDGNC